MRIKHWSGYGSINAKKLNCDKFGLTVKVFGNHEQGLDRSYDRSDVFDLFVKKFDKKIKDYTFITSVDFTRGDFEKVNGIVMETGIYNIKYRVDI